MTLALMLRTDAAALTCDMAETYHVLRMRALPARLLATLACGLREDSRIMMRLSGRRINLRDTLAAAACDRLSLLLWAQTKAAQHGRNRPKSLVELLSRRDATEGLSVSGYTDAEAFLRAREEFLLDSEEA